MESLSHRRRSTAGCRGAVALLALALFAGPVGPAGAAVITVGAGGSQVTIGAGIASALTTSGTHEVRVRAGTYEENIQVSMTLDRTVTVTGGWDATFATRNDDPALTVVDAEQDGRVFGLVASTGHVTLDGLTLRNGLVEVADTNAAFGAGVAANLSNSGKLTLRNLVIHDNQALAPLGTAAGGGIFASGIGQSTRLTIEDCAIRDNRIEGKAVFGGGADLFFSSGPFVITNNRFERNAAIGQTLSQNGGFGIFADGSVNGNIIGNLISGNTATLETGGTVGVDISPDPAQEIRIGLGSQQGVPTTSGFVNVKNNFIGPFQPLSGGQQQPGCVLAALQSFGANNSSVYNIYNNAVVNGGDCGGLQAQLAGVAEAFFANLTIARNLFGLDVDLDGGFAGAVSVFGLFLSLNGSDIDVPPRSGFAAARTLVDGNVSTDDLGVFANPEYGDFRPLPGSPGIDAGLDDPFGGLPETDLEGNPRVAGAHVDAGAYELGPSTCVSSPDGTNAPPWVPRLCLNGDEFEARFGWRTVDIPAPGAAADTGGGGEGARGDGGAVTGAAAQAGRAQATTPTIGEGHVVELTNDTGYSWFFKNTNVELLLKVLNACGVNNRYWVFAGGLTDVGVGYTVTDTRTGIIVPYSNERGTPFAPSQDTGAFDCDVEAIAAARLAEPVDAPAEGRWLVRDSWEAPASWSEDPSSLRFGAASGAGPDPGSADLTAACTASPTALCLAGNRFRVEVDWERPSGQSGEGQAIPLTSDTGVFWFFNDLNLELVVKVLNACGVNNRFWVFAGGLTNVEVTITVTDTTTGAVKTYTNPLNTPFEPLQDTGAFSCS